MTSLARSSRSELNGSAHDAIAMIWNRRKALMARRFQLRGVALPEDAAAGACFGAFFTFQIINGRTLVARRPEDPMVR